MSATSPTRSITSPSGTEHPIFPTDEDIEADIVTLFRGPYTLHISFVESQGEIFVQQIEVQQRRPALLGVDRFADIRELRTTDIDSLQEVKSI